MHAFCFKIGFYRLDTDIHRRAKKLVQSKNCSRTIDEYRSLEKRHIPSPLSISSSGLPSVDWKTKRVVLDENGVTAKVRSSGELDMQVVMNRKQRAALMLTDPRGRAEASRNFFKSEGLVPGSTIRQQRKVRRRENDIEDEAQEAYESKIAMDALKRQMKINSINKALVNELTVLNIVNTFAYSFVAIHNKIYSVESFHVPWSGTVFVGGENRKYDVPSESSQVAYMWGRFD
jgi:hypothetical protein